MTRLSLNAVVGGLIIAIVAIVAITGAVWTPYDPLKIDFGARLAAPSPGTGSAPTSSAATSAAG